MRLRARDLLLASAVLTGVAATATASTVDLGSLFPEEAEILAEGEGVHRLDLPVEVLTACRPDLSDLRVFDGAGKEVPYLVDSGLGPDEELHVKQTLPAPILDVKREVIERVFEMHAEYCPVYRSICSSIEITTELEMENA